VPWTEPAAAAARAGVRGEDSGNVNATNPMRLAS
jgi:hypothetical protein